MKLNREYREVLKRGAWLDKQTFRKENDSAFTMFFCLMLSFLIISFCFIRTVHSDVVCNDPSKLTPQLQQAYNELKDLGFNVSVRCLNGGEK